jgi:acetyltransferase-like isoleucine patch superfamily enzyme
MYSDKSDVPISIGKDVWISHGVFAEATGGQIVLDDYVVIAHRSMLLTSSGPGKKSYVMDELFPVECGDIRIGAHTWIGANVTLLPNVILHEGVVIGAHSLTRRGVYDSWTLYAGIPCKPIRKINKTIDGKEITG